MMDPKELMHAEHHSSQDLTAWIGCEKFDGLRAWWDGSTLWSRDGGDYHPPHWFTRGLPPYPLDCELFAGYGKRECLSNAMRTDPERWRSLKLVVFDSPTRKGGYSERLASLAGCLVECAYAELIKSRVLTSTADGWKWAREILGAGGEGVIAYDGAKEYRSGPQHDVVTLKINLTAGSVIATP